MKLLLLLVLTCVGVAEGGGVSGTCPAVCRCEGAGMLQRVDCVNVGLRSVPSNLSSFTSSLRLDANLLSRLPRSSFADLPSLRHLRLDANALTEVPVLALRPLTDLQALTLALNAISRIPDRAFASLRRLLVLYLHDNSIHSLGQRSFVGLRDLETLDLSFNRIHRFPAAVKHLRNLRELNLQSNNISVVPKNAFRRNPSIQIINIQNNPVHTVGHPSFQRQPDLQSLDLSSNRMSVMSLKRLRQTGSLQRFRDSHQPVRVTEMQPVCCCLVFPRSDPVDQMSEAPPTQRLHSSVFISLLLLLLLSSRCLLYVLVFWLQPLIQDQGSGSFSPS